MLKWGVKKRCVKTNTETKHLICHKTEHTHTHFHYLGYIQALTTSTVIQRQYSEMHTNKVQDLEIYPYAHKFLVHSCY